VEESASPKTKVSIRSNFLSIQLIILLDQLLSLKKQDGDISDETPLPQNRKRWRRVESTTTSEKESEKKSLKTGEREKSPKLLHVDPLIDNLISKFLPPYFELQRTNEVQA